MSPCTQTCRAQLIASQLQTHSTGKQERHCLAHRSDLALVAGAAEGHLAAQVAADAMMHRLAAFLWGGRLHLLVPAVLGTRALRALPIGRAPPLLAQAPATCNTQACDQPSRRPQLAR